MEKLVLILVLLELILLPDIITVALQYRICFNPCFIGTYSFTQDTVDLMLGADLF